MTLTVDGQPGGAGAGWVANTGTKADAVASDNGDTAYIETGTDTAETHFTFTNPSVASGDIASITSVQLITAGRFPSRGSGGEDVDFVFDNAPGSGLAETLNYPNAATHNARSGTVHTVNTGGSAWAYSDLETVEIQITKNTASSPATRVGYISLRVIYVAAVAADNSIFFGTNF